jgi:hypothetical protein
MGTLLTTNQDKAEAFKAPALSSRDIADILGHPESRDEVEAYARQGDKAVIVQARDAADRVIAEAPASAPRIGATAGELYPQVPTGGRLVAVSPEEAQKRRIDPPPGQSRDTIPGYDLDLSSRKRLEEWARGLGIAFSPATSFYHLRAQVLEGLEAYTQPGAAGKMKLRIETAIDRAGAPRGLSLIRPQLEDYAGRTLGVLFTKEGIMQKLKSGAPDPRYAKYPAAKHVEGKAAIFMRDIGSSGGIVYHNNTDGTCGSCRSNLPTLLPKGATLFVVPPRNPIPKNRQAESRARPYGGNGRMPISNSQVELWK